MEDPLQGSSNEVCRICRNGASPDQPLYYPCLCSGSIKYIHQDCLIEWLKHSKKRYCELCKHPFTFSPVYAEQMPTKIPFSVLLTGLVRKTFSITRIAISWAFAALLWLFVVPIITSQIFRYYFGWSLQGFFNAFFMGVLETAEIEDFFLETSLSLLFDALQGFLLTGFTVFLILGMMLVREFLSMVRVMPSETTRPAMDYENIPPETSNFTETSPLLASPVDTQPSITSPLSPSRRNSELNTPVSPSQPTPLSPSRGSGNYWLDQVHPKEYRNYMRRRELHREMMELNEGTASPFDAADASFTSENPEDLMSNISGTTTLRSRFTNVTTATSNMERPLEIFRCRVCSSTTCISREHVIQASRQRNALSAQRHQSLLSRAVEETRANNTDENTPADNRNDNRTDIRNNNRNDAHNNTATNAAGENDGFGWNLDAAESLSFPEFFGFSSEGTPVLELFQNASIVVGCNALVMHLFLFVPFITGKAVYGGSLYLLLANTLNFTISKLFDGQIFNFQTLSNAISSNRYLALLAFEKDSFFGFAFTITLGYAALCSLLSIYVGLTRKMTDAFHRTFIPIISFVGTFIKLLALLFIEMAVFPLLCGFLVDFVLLPLFPGASIYARLESVHSLPVSSLVIHWALGAFFMISFASSVAFLRSFLRPGLLFFLRNPLDPDNHPVKEMVERDFFDQISRLGISFIFYAALIACSLGLSVKILNSSIVKSLVFPLNLSFADPLIEIPVDLLLHLLLRWLIKHSAPTRLFKSAFIGLSKRIFRALKLSSYFLGKGRYLNEESANSGSWVAVPDFDRFYTRAQMKSIRCQQILPADVAALKIVVDKSGHPVMDDENVSSNSNGRFRDWTIAFRPNFFKTKCFLTVLSLIAVIQAFLLLIFVGPLLSGRLILHCLKSLDSKVHEVYTWSLGAVVLTLAFKAVELVFFNYSHQSIFTSSATPNRQSSSLLQFNSIKATLLRAFKATLLIFFLGILWPLQVGLLFTLTVNPLIYTHFSRFDQLQMHQSSPAAPLLQSIPIVFVGTCWSLGFPFLRILYSLRSQLPLSSSSLNYLQGITGTLSVDFNLMIFLKHCAWPITLLLSLSLLLPPLAVLLIMGAFSPASASFENVIELQQFAHLTAIVAYFLIKAIGSTVKFFHSLYNGIRDETYLVGRRLHNLENRTDNSNDIQQRSLPNSPLNQTDVMSPLI